MGGQQAGAHSQVLPKHVVCIQTLGSTGLHWERSFQTSRNKAASSFTQSSSNHATAIIGATYEQRSSKKRSEASDVIEYGAQGRKRVNA